VRRRVDEFDNTAGALADYLAVKNEDRSEGRLPLVLQGAPGKLYGHAKVVSSAGVSDDIGVLFLPLLRGTGPRLERCHEAEFRAVCRVPGVGNLDEITGAIV
jgi:hypothetical protein